MLMGIINRIVAFYILTANDPMVMIQAVYGGGAKMQLP